MMDFIELEQYFPEVNNLIFHDGYSFKISMQQDDDYDSFAINLKIKQQDKKEEKLIKFRFGLGKDKALGSVSHKTDSPHFEIDFYNR